LPCQPLADPRFAAPAAVSVRRIEEVDAHFPGGIHDGKGFFFGFALAEESRRAANAAKVAAAQPNDRNFQPCPPQIDVAHAMLQVMRAECGETILQTGRTMRLVNCFSNWTMTRS